MSPLGFETKKQAHKNDPELVSQLLPLSAVCGLTHTGVGGGDECERSDYPTRTKLCVRVSACVGEKSEPELLVGAVERDFI